MLKPRLAIAAVAGLALLSACGGSSGDHTAAPPATTAASSSPSSVTNGQAASAASEPAAGPTTAPAAAGASTSSTTKASAPAGAPTPHPAKPGSYTYDVSGSARSGIGAFPVPPTATMVIEAAKGHDQRGRRDSPQGSTTQTLRFGSDGVRLVEQTADSPQGSIDLRPDNPVLIVPASPTAGQRWSWDMTSTDGKVTVHSTSTVLRKETVNVGGKSIDTVVVRSVTTTSGSFTSTIDSTSWWAPEASVPVRQDSTSRGTYNGMEFQAQTSERLRSVEPS